MGNVHFDVASVFILTLNLFFFISRRKISAARIRLFGNLLLISLFATVADIASILMYERVADFPLWAHLVVNTFFYLAQNTIAVAFLRFLLSLLGEDDSYTATRLLTYLPWVVSMAIILSSPVTGLAFGFDAQLGYHRGPALPVLYAIAVFYAGFGLFKVLANRRRLSRDTWLAVLLFLPFSLMPVLIQFLLPEVLIQNLGIAISELFILLTILDFGKYLHPVSRMFNANGLAMQLETVRSRYASFTVFLIALDSVEFLRFAMGPDLYLRLEQAVAARLSAGKNGERIHAQIGPGMFATVQGDHALAEARREELLNLFAKPITVQDRAITISARICAIAFPEDARDIRVVFQAQRELLRMRTRLAESSMLSLGDLALSDTGRKHEVELAIREALADDALLVHFQPIVSAADGKVATAEALVRLYNERLGWISPAEFIPIAEQNGTIHQIGDIVIERCCRFLSALEILDLHLDYLEINLSAAQCIQSNLADRMLVALRRHKLMPQRVMFEVTETAANQSPTLMQKNLESLVGVGFGLAIDDFGTGYSNLTTLMKLPFSTVKIDRSLVLAMEQTMNARIGVEGLVAMLHRLGTDIVAEGVETAAQVELMRQLGVDQIQGYYYSKPLPEEEFVRFLKNQGAACT